MYFTDFCCFQYHFAISRRAKNLGCQWYRKFEIDDDVKSVNQLAVATTTFLESLFLGAVSGTVTLAKVVPNIQRNANYVGCQLHTVPVVSGLALIFIFTPHKAQRIVTTCADYLSSGGSDLNSVAQLIALIQRGIYNQTLWPYWVCDIIQGDDVMIHAVKIRYSNFRTEWEENS